MCCGHNSDKILRAVSAYLALFDKILRAGLHSLLIPAAGSCTLRCGGKECLLYFSFIWSKVAPEQAPELGGLGLAGLCSEAIGVSKSSERLSAEYVFALFAKWPLLPLESETGTVLSCC